MSSGKDDAGEGRRKAGETADEFAHVLKFGTLEEAEATLRRLDAFWRESRAANDAGRAARVLEIAREGRRRAQMISGNTKVGEAKRLEKEEIRQWFRMWLEAPETFFDWLELRKTSSEYVARFGGD